jgi:hydroxypyruvate isomerase
MKRREFLTAGMAAAGGALLSERATGQEFARRGDRCFRLDYAPHFGMFKHLAGDDFVDQLRFAAEQGFSAWEDRVIGRRPPELQRRIAGTMETLGLRMGAITVPAPYREGASMSAHLPCRYDLVREIGQSIELARRVNARWIAVDFAYHAMLTSGERPKAACVEAFKRCAELLQRHDLVLVLEAAPRQDATRRGPDDSLSRVLELCEAVDRPSCKLLFDLYQQAVAGADVVARFDAYWPQIAYFRCGDSRGRKEPGTGEIDYPRIFDHLVSRGFRGVVGMEHGNSLPGPEGDQAVIDAYLRVDRC